MAKLKRPADGRAVQSRPVGAVIPLDVVLCGPRPADPIVDAVWRSLRRKLAAAECGHPKFDPRRLLTMNVAERREWLSARRRWAADLFREDSRVRRTEWPKERDSTSTPRKRN
jgi:hypothetical protein